MTTKKTLIDAAHDYTCSDAIHPIADSMLAFGDFINGAEWTLAKAKRFFKDTDLYDKFIEFIRYEE